MTVAQKRARGLVLAWLLPCCKCRYVSRVRHVCYALNFSKPKIALDDVSSPFNSSMATTKILSHQPKKYENVTWDKKDCLIRRTLVCPFLFSTISRTKEKETLSINEPLPHISTKLIGFFYGSLPPLIMTPITCFLTAHKMRKNMCIHVHTKTHSFVTSGA